MIGAAAPRLLPLGRGPMPLIVGMLLFLTTLAAAAALALSSVAVHLESGDRMTVQVMTPDPAARDAEAMRITSMLQRAPGVVAARSVGAEEMEALLAPWLGSGIEDDLPIPALIEVELHDGADQQTVARSVRAIAPTARIEAEAQTLAPVRRLVSLLRWLSLGLAVVATLATALTVGLAARSALAAQGETIALMHLLGATDRQLVRLFERRAAWEALVGGTAGWSAALLVLLAVARQLEALGDVPLGTMAIGAGQMWPLLLLPPLSTLLAMLVARITLLRALKRDR